MSGEEVPVVVIAQGRSGTWRDRLGAFAERFAAPLGTTGSVASAPSTALRAAAVVSMNAIGFMEPSVALAFINLNHEFGVPIKWANA
jgi:hypothetical protein